MKHLVQAFLFFVFFLRLPWVTGQNLDSWFPKEDLMKIGVYYYPEQWPKSQWERDFKNMAGQGFQFTHLAEFAWAFLEPEEGRYDFAWLDEAIDLAAKNGLKVILCTPSAAPPVWLTEKYPEVLIQGADGMVMEHGSRAHASWSSQKYRELNEKIITALAKRYGQDKRIWGWQIDNEPSHYAVEYDYSPPAQTRFAAWLKEKYGSIEKLNETWGTSFWSIRYQRFEQIRSPNPRKLPQQANPHAMLDFRRFSAEECAGFVRFQAEILKKNVTKSQWVTTNFMSFHQPNDPSLDMGLDFVTLTSYPVAGYAAGLGPEGFRINESSTLGQPLDYFRSLSGKTAVMELQPGQVNWGRYNPQPFPGAVRLWLYQALGSGAAFVCSYRYRQPLFGGEQYHYGMVGPDGVTPSPGGLEYQQTLREMASLRSGFKPEKEWPASLKAIRTGILYKRDNTWDMNYQRQTNQWNSAYHVTKYYEAARRFQAPVDFLEEKDNFGDYPVLMVPAYQLVDDALVKKLTRYAENGGHLVISCRFGQKDNAGRLWEGPYQEPLRKLAGTGVKFFDVLPDERYGKVQYQSRNFEWNNWGEILEPEASTQVLARYIDQYYKNSPAVVQRKAGKGTVTYIGVETDAFQLEREVLKSIYSQVQGKEARELEEGLDIRYRDGLWVALNFHSSESRTVSLPANARILVGEPVLKPCGVLVWTEKKP